MVNKISSKVFLIIALIAIVLAGYFYYELNRVKKDPAGQAQVQAKKEVESLVAKVGKLVVLPDGEIPTVATVSDPEALRDQQFFANAVKGDKVLIYAEAKKAFLYSVAQNKIIDVAPLNIGNSQRVTPPSDNKSDN